MASHHQSQGDNMERKELEEFGVLAAARIENCMYDQTPNEPEPIVGLGSTREHIWRSRVPNLVMANIVLNRNTGGSCGDSKRKTTPSNSIDLPPSH